MKVNLILQIYDIFAGDLFLIYSDSSHNLWIFLSCIQTHLTMGGCLYNICRYVSRFVSLWTMYISNQEVGMKIINTNTPPTSQPLAFSQLIALFVINISVIHYTVVNFIPNHEMQSIKVYTQPNICLTTRNKFRPINLSPVNMCQDCLGRLAYSWGPCLVIPRRTNWQTTRNCHPNVTQVWWHLTNGKILGSLEISNKEFFNEIMSLIHFTLGND